MKKGYLLVTALVLVAAAAIFVAAIVSFISNTSALRAVKEELFIASNASMSGIQMGTSYLAHFANSIGSFDLDFNGPGSVPFTSISWLQPNTPNNYFSAIYSSIDGDAWKKALSVLATDSNVLWLNKIPQVENFFESLHASNLLSVIPDVVVIQTKIPKTTLNSKYRYFVVARAQVGREDVYSSGFVVANMLNKYLYFTDIEPSDIYFTTGELIDGPLRSNDVINIDGNPIFNGFVQAKGYNITRGSSPIFDSGHEVLSAEDIAKMNMKKIASYYSSEINSEISAPASIEANIKEGSNFPVGIDLSGLKWNLYGFKEEGNWFKWKKGGYYTPSRLALMFQEDLDNWLINTGYSYSELPQDVLNQYQEALNAIKSIMPAVKITFDSNGNSKTMIVYYSDTPTVSNVISAINELVNNDYWWYWWWYNGPDFSDVLDVLDNVKSNGNNWNPLFMINPVNNSSIPGTATLNPEGNDAAMLMGLSSSSPITFKFNGVLKTSSDLYISGKKNQQGNNDKTAYISGKYTLYTTQSAYIQSNIVYNDANTLFSASNSDWLDSKVSTSMIEELRNSTCSDFLNIVANDDVTLTSEVPYNMKLMASVYAFTGSFSYEDWNNSNPMGQLFLYGSLMQHKRGPVGTFDPRTYENISGFYKTYSFDWRILGGLPSNMYGTPSAKKKALLLSLRTVY